MGLGVGNWAGGEESGRGGKRRGESETSQALKDEGVWLAGLEKPGANKANDFCDWLLENEFSTRHTNAD